MPATAPASAERDLGYEVVARVAGSATIQQARLEVEAIANGVNVPGWRDAGRRIGLVPLKDEVIGDRAAALSLLLAAVGLLLAIACANLAQLLLARSDRRLTEFATRKALGASGRELFRLALCESLLISLAGGLAGLLLAYSLVPLMLMLAPAEIPRLADAAVNGRVMAAAMIISVVSGCAFGLAPAWRLSRLSVVQAMKHSSGPASRRRIPLRSALVVTQVALAVTLLAVAGLVIQVFVTLVPSSPGFATGSRSAFVWDIRESQYPDVEDRRRRVNDLIGRLESVPGISSAAVATAIPFGDDEPRLVPVRPRYEVGGVNDQTPRAGLRAVSPGFFSVFQIPFLQGRPFSPGDTGSAPRVAIVNRTLARTLGSPDNVIGLSVRIGTSPTAPAHEIVGVVDDATVVGNDAGSARRDLYAARTGPRLVWIRGGRFATRQPGADQDHQKSLLWSRARRAVARRPPGDLPANDDRPIDRRSPVQCGNGRRVLSPGNEPGGGRPVRPGGVFGGAPPSRARGAHGPGCTAGGPGGRQHAIGHAARRHRQCVGPGRRAPISGG